MDMSNYCSSRHLRYYFSPLCATTTVIDVVVDVNDAEVCREMLCTKQIHSGSSPVQIQADPNYLSRPGHQCKGALLGLNQNHYTIDPCQFQLMLRELTF